MNKALKKIIALSIIGVFMATGSGCGSSSTTSSKKTVNIQIATWANSDESKQFNTIIGKINASQKEYKITQVVIPNNYYDKIQTMIAGNQAPDLFWLSQEYIPLYAKDKAIVDVTSKTKSQTAIKMNDFYKASLDTAKYKGSTYGLPFIGQPYMVYYNKDLFKKNGIAEPDNTWTWSQFQSTAQKLTKNGAYGLADPGVLPLQVFLWGEGGQLIDKNNNVKLDSAASIAGLKVANKLLNDKSATMPYNQSNSIGSQQAFVDQKAAMVFGGADDGVEQAVKDAGGKFNVGMAMIPAGTKAQKTFNFCASTVVSSQTKNKQASEDAMVALTKAMFDWKVPSPVKSKMSQIGKVLPIKAYAADVIAKSAKISLGNNNTPVQNEIGDIELNNLDLPIYTNNNGKGGVNVDKLAKDTANLMRAKLK